MYARRLLVLPRRDGFRRAPASGRNARQRRPRDRAGTAMAVRQVECLGNCKRRLSAAHAARRLLELRLRRPDAGKRPRSDRRRAALRDIHGRLAALARPPGLPQARARRPHSARLPFSRTLHDRIPQSRSLHRRHRLSRRRQDDDDPPHPRKRRRKAAGADRQRIRRCRHRRRNPQGLRRRGLPGGKHHRTRQWLPVLHRRRRFRPGARLRFWRWSRRSITSSSRPPASPCRSRWCRRSSGRR